MIQPIGILLAWVGFIIALVGPFNVLGSGVTDVQLIHAWIGTIVMVVGGFIQPLNAYLRPHKEKQTNNEQEENHSEQPIINQHRIRWEYLHKGIGYCSAFVAGVNCFIGVLLSGKYQDKFLYAIIAAWAGLACYAITMIFHRCLCSKDKEEFNNSNQHELQQFQPNADDIADE